MSSTRRKNIQISLHELLPRVSGKAFGAPDRSISALCPLEAPVEGGLSFAKSPGKRSRSLVAQAGSLAALLVPLDSAETFSFPDSSEATPTLVEVTDPAAAFFSLIPLFYEPSIPPQGVSPLAQVDPTASIHPSAYVGAFAVIGPRVSIAAEAQIHPHVVLYADVSIGAGSVLHSGVHVREQCSIGEHCTLHNGVIVGADGFGYLPKADGQLSKVPQVGTVRIGNHVEIGANACIDRATLGETVIGDGSKIDNLAQVGHNVQVGRSVIVCGQVGIGGSARIGNHVVLGGQTGVKDHVSIAGGTRVAARSGVSNDLEPGDYAGYPAVPAHEWKRQHTALSRITKVAARLVALVRERR